MRLRLVAGVGGLTSPVIGGGMILWLVIGRGVLPELVVGGHMLGRLLVRQGVVPRSVGGAVLSRPVIGRGPLHRFVVWDWSLLIPVDLPLLLFKEGGGGGPAAAPTLQKCLISPVISPAPGQIDPPPLYQHLDLSPALIVHSTLPREAGVPGAVGVFVWTGGRRGGDTQHRTEIRCYYRRRGVGRAQFWTVCSR